MRIRLDLSPFFGLILGEVPFARDTPMNTSASVMASSVEPDCDVDIFQ